MSSSVMKKKEDDIEKICLLRDLVGMYKGNWGEGQYALALDILSNVQPAALGRAIIECGRTSPFMPSMHDLSVLSSQYSEIGYTVGTADDAALLWSAMEESDSA